MALKILDFQPDTGIVREEVLEGLRKPAKALPSKLLYDENGSLLFDRITRLKEYYPTRTEASIMRGAIDQISELVGENALLIEYGSGNSEKTRILLHHLRRLTGYVPIDISKEHLIRAAAAVAREFPELDVQPVCADYTRPFHLPAPSGPVSHRLVYYPGSTIGNFHRDAAMRFLRSIATMAGARGSLLLGVDLKKDVGTLMSAYNDSENVTAAFNLNLLERLNRELGADFKVGEFIHQAVYNKSEGRIEMHLISTRKQKVNLDGTRILFEEGETIWTESSYKYSLEEFEKLANEAGFEVRKVWTDPDRLFSVQYLVVMK